MSTAYLNAGKVKEGILLIRINLGQGGWRISRKLRKKEHLEYALKTSQLPAENGFSDIFLVYDALPDLNFKQIDTSLEFLKKKLKAPLLINAMTGGHPEVKQINRSLAAVAARAGIAMAVGSQTAGLEDPQVRDTYRIARDENPAGVLLANLSALAAPPMVKEAVEMIEADGVQLHLNVAQELAMPEGDRNFRGALANIEKISALSPVPVIVKEVGFGLSREAVRKIYEAGVRHIDISGKGGTDFIRIEYLRSGKEYRDKFRNIGIPAASSLLEALSLDLPLTVIASGGFRDGSDLACAFALGAGLVGMARHFLQVLIEGSEQELEKRVEIIIDDLRRTMMMAGAANLRELAEKPVIITGGTAEWLIRRGIDPNRYSLPGHGRKN
ncbi:MAG TPA: type 2 isopentenyl-diphosphate Delta-isomerase [Desulfitobacteriaceae bacterium]|nr:type 2 isopentenyl-diphosphate Delta-isomerase [Desulfitobacteriaceae bacterium]